MHRLESALGMLSSRPSQLRIDFLYNTYLQLYIIVYNTGHLNGETGFLVCNPFRSLAPRGSTQEIDLYVTSLSMTKTSGLGAGER